MLLALGQQVGADHDLAYAVEFQSAVVEAAGPTDARRPDLQRGGHALATLELEAIRVGGHDPHPGAHVHAQQVQLGCGQVGDRLRECAENARRGFQQGQAQPPADLRLTVAGRQLDHAGQLGGQLHTSGAAANDGNVDVAALGEAAHHMRAQPRVESVGLVVAVDEVAVLDDAGRAKVVCAAAERQHQDIVGKLSDASDHLAIRLERREADAPGCAVDGIELAGNVIEMMHARVHHELHLLLIDVPGAGGEGVQHRLPDVDPASVDEADPGSAAASQQAAEPGGQYDAGNPAADHNDVWNLTSVRFDPRFYSRKLHATTLVDYLSAISHLVSPMGLQWLARCCEPSSPGRRA